MIAATFVCPLDVIKTRLQVNGLPKLGDGAAKGNRFFGFVLDHDLSLDVCILFGVNLGLRLM